MKVFCDTNVLVAASESSHSHFARAHPVLQSIVSGAKEAYVSAHSLAEAYSALTRMPGPVRIHPLDAKGIIEANVLPYFNVVLLDVTDYRRALDRVSSLGLPGARIYDALILECAAKSGADLIYTFDVAHFLPLASIHLAPKICAP